VPALAGKGFLRQRRGSCKSQKGFQGVGASLADVNADKDVSGTRHYAYRLPASSDRRSQNHHTKVVNWI
jgi:hypothetical protein